jgi:hypothetical protein
MVHAEPDLPCGPGDLVTRYRLLARLLGGPLSGAEAERWIRKHEAEEAVVWLQAAGRLRRIADDGLALQPDRLATAMDAMTRDLSRQGGGARPRPPVERD